MTQKHGCRPPGCTALLALMMACSVSADDGVPALLQFAEQYQQQSKPTEAEKAATAENVPEKKGPSSPLAKKTSVPVRQPATGSAVKAFTLRQQGLLARDQQLARQRVELEALRQEVANLRAEKAALQVAQPPSYMQPLQKLVAVLGEVWRGSPDAQHASGLLRQAVQQVEQLKQEAEQANKRIAALTEVAQKAALMQNTRQQEGQAALLALRTKLEDNEQKLAAQQKMALKAEADLATLRQRTPWNMTAAELNDEEKRMSYAAGTALGQDIQTLIAERQGWGIPIERNSLLAGVIDSASGRELLPPAALAALQEKADAMATAARQAKLDTLKQRDDVFLANFRKQKDTKQSPMGFWYRINYSGQGEMAKDAVIDIAVKETLTDGTVVQDMDLSDKILSQPLTAYPPLFREAIGHLRNHGSITLVVPPALAYGETGYPPKVPPNSTMIYELRINDSRKP